MVDLDENTVTDAALEQMANTASPRLMKALAESLASSPKP